MAYHHAGLPVEVQEAVEDAIRSETIRAVVATSTLTDGVNLPVRTVVIATTEYDGQDPGQRMSAAQLLNAVGRAGRPARSPRAGSCSLCRRPWKAATSIG